MFLLDNNPLNVKFVTYIQYEARKLHSLFEHMSRIFAYNTENRKKWQTNSEKLEPWQPCLRKKTDELGQGHTKA